MMKTTLTAFSLLILSTFVSAETATYSEWKAFEYVQTPAIERAFTWSEVKNQYELTRPAALEPLRRHILARPGILNRYRDAEPIFWYEGVRNVEMLRFYEEFGIDYALTDSKGQTIVHSAALQMDNIGLRSLRYLVDSKRLPPDQSDSQGVTPFRVAACNAAGVNDLAVDSGFSNTGILRYLASKGASTRVRAKGNTAVECAREAGRSERILQLLEELAAAR